jgi:nucleotide-binding universal stress UspA family protein
MKHNKILVPLDGSEFSLQVFPYIQELFPPTTNDLILLRVVSPLAAATGDALWMATADLNVPVLLPYPTLTTALDWKEFNAVLQSELKHYGNDLQEAGYTVNIAIQMGDPTQEIPAFVEQADINIVAMTTHGRSGLARLFLGSVAEATLRRVHVPVLLVQPTA